MLITTAVAIVFALGQYVKWVFLLPLAAIPFCFTVEWILERTSERPVEPSRFSKIKLLVFIIAAMSTPLAGFISMSAPSPRVHSPFALLSVLPYFYHRWFTFGIPFLRFLVRNNIIPLIVFVILNCDLFRNQATKRFPLRLGIILFLATAFSVCWFMFSYEVGIEYQGKEYTYTVATINIAFATLLWIIIFVKRDQASFPIRLFFSLLLNFWLFWFAFPWLGETP
jgi:hypothetical protein